MEQNIGLGVLTFAVGTQAPTDIQILPASDFRSDDGSGRPSEVDSWKINATIAQKLIAKLNSRKNDLLIDYEHQSLMASVNGQPVPAAGWFKNMEWRDGSGMWVTKVDLTNKAKGHIAEKEYRYISPVFTYDKKTGEIIEIVSLAFTNTPAVDGMAALAACTEKFLINYQSSGVNHMSTEQVAALNIKVTGLETQLANLSADKTKLQGEVTALTAERDSYKAKAEAVQQEAAKAKEAADTKAHADLLQTALTDGRLVPAQKPWAEKQSLEALTAYLETAPVILDGKLQHEKKTEGGNELGLDETELAMCSQMNIKPEDFAKTKADLAKSQ